jgi:hypothetical protein
MALLHAYGDASFTEAPGRAPVTAIGCYVGTEEAWTAVEKAWLENLALWGLKEFHLAPLLAGQCSVSDPLLCALTFARIIEKSSLHGLHAARRDDAPVTKFDAYNAAFDRLLGVLAEHMSAEFPGDAVAIVMDKDAPEDAARALFERRRQAIPSQFVSLTFSTREAFRLLECADLLAGEHRKAWLNRKPGHPPETSALIGFAGGVRGRGAFWSPETEREIAAMLDRLRKEKEARDGEG